MVDENKGAASAALPSAGEAEPWTRYDLAKGLAMFDGVTLRDVKSTVGDPKDANNWRWYLGRADDLLAHLSASAHPSPSASEAQADKTLRLAVAAVLEADKEFRRNLPSDWEGDPLSDELDGLRRVFEALSTPEHGETAPAPEMIAAAWAA